MQVPKWLLATERADYWDFVLNSILAEYVKPRSNIKKMIDEATGFAKMNEIKNKEVVIGILKRIIKYKKRIPADYSKYEKLLNELINLE